MSEEEVEFRSWGKIPRMKEDKICITEKINGTNSCVVIKDEKIVAVQSRKRFITSESDNFGFAKWVNENEGSLVSMGDGYHFGEWAGEGIQKNPHKLEGKNFFLFNTKRWNIHNPNTPEVCKVVPVLYDGVWTPIIVQDIMDALKERGTYVSEGVDYAEGVVVYYKALDSYVKDTFENSQGKWLEKKKEQEATTVVAS